MTNMNLLWAMGHIDPDLIVAESPDVPRRKSTNKAWVKWTALAACLALLITAVSIGNFAKKPPETPSQGVLPPVTGTDFITATETEPGEDVTLPVPEVISSGMEENGKPVPTYRIAARTVSYCVKGETLTVDLFMGDLYSFIQWEGKDPSYDTYGANGYPMLKVYGIVGDGAGDDIENEDSPLLFNGLKAVYEKIFSAEEMKELDLFDGELWCEKPLSEWRRESVEVDLGALKPGDSGEMVFCFGWRYEEHPRGEGFFEYFSRVLSYYVGEDVIGFSFGGLREAIEIADKLEGPSACYLEEYDEKMAQLDRAGEQISVGGPNRLRP